MSAKHARSHSTGSGGMSKTLKRVLISAGGLAVLGGVGVGVALSVGQPKVSVAAGRNHLFTLKVGGAGATLSSVTASAGGHSISLVRSGSGYIPASAVPQGETVTVTATASAPSWLGWLVGSGASQTITVRTPAASPSGSLALAPQPGHLPVNFSAPVSVVNYSFGSGPMKTLRLATPSTQADLPSPAAILAGKVTVSASPLPWEQPQSQPSTLTWFVQSPTGPPVAIVNPSPGSSTATSVSPISVTFDQPVSKVLGSSRPTLSPSVAGSWSQPGPDQLVFTPSGFGYGAGSTETVSFGRSVNSIGSSSASVSTAAAVASESFKFQTAPASLLRLEQILAQLHYIPLKFTPASGVNLPTTMAGEVASMSQPLAGSFSWRWATTPASLQSQWTVGAANQMVKGALMDFNAVRNAYDGYNEEFASVAQLATPSLWQALLQASLAKQMDPNPYSYVYVTEQLPETLTLWKNGSVVLTAAANTGLPGYATQLGTYPIYIRFTQNWMNGTNPNGTKYHDMVYWINYFYGGDAVHAFPRATYGSPQSLGCVELPKATAQVAFNDLAIGDLVTVVS